jgi:NTP pyrophosphatase (non-canonical NTP hydrolase)
MSYWNLLNQAIEKFGATEQENLAIEECSELIQAISHKHRGREHNIAEEIADVEIMLDQLRIINDCFYEVANIKEIKLERLEERLRGETV